MKIAVIIPCRNEVNNIVECIEAIYASYLPDNWAIQVIVVDGKSNDGTLEVLAQLQQKYQSLEIETNELQLTPYAFNLGIKFGTGNDYFQIIGARQIISKNYLFEAASKLNSDATIWCIGGSVENVYLNEVGNYIADAMCTSFGMGLGNFRTISSSGFVDTVGTPMYPSWVFDRIGYFDEDLVRNQDDEFNFRVTQAGGKIYFSNEISLKYYVRGNYKQLWKQFFQYGYWKVFVNKKHRAVTTSRQLIPPLFCLFLLTYPLTWFLHPFLAFGASALLGLYFLLILITSIRLNPRKFMHVALVFPLLHISYGMGYLNGIFRFLILGLPPADKRAKLSR